MTEAAGKSSTWDLTGEGKLVFKIQFPAQRLCFLLAQEKEGPDRPEVKTSSGKTENPFDPSTASAPKASPPEQAQDPG
jgi:hypothetical protein